MAQSLRTVTGGAGRNIVFGDSILDNSFSLGREVLGTAAEWFGIEIPEFRGQRGDHVQAQHVATFDIIDSADGARQRRVTDSPSTRSAVQPVAVWENIRDSLVPLARDHLGSTRASPQRRHGSRRPRRRGLSSRRRLSEPSSRLAAKSGARLEVVRRVGDGSDMS